MKIDEIKELAIKERNLDLEKQALHIKISGPQSYEYAGNLLSDVADHIKKVKEWFGPMVKKAHEVHKEIKKKENEALEPAQKVNKILRNKMQDYLLKVEQDRQAEQRRLEAAAAAKAEAERKALLKRAAAAKKDSTTERLQEEAALVEPEPVIAEPKIDKTTRTETATISQLKDYELEVTDIKQFLKEVLYGEVPQTVIKIDIIKLKQYIKSTDKKNGSIKGLQIKEIFKPMIRPNK